MDTHLENEEEEKMLRCCKNGKMGYWIAIGTGVGTALGVALDQLALGVALGPAIGMVLGLWSKAHLT